MRLMLDEIAVGWKERGPDSQSAEPSRSADERPDSILPGQFSVQ